MKTLRAPFPYAGYKGKVSGLVWERLGNPKNYVEPFFGSGAVLLQRPQVGRREVVNDKYGLLSNFWRSVRVMPHLVAEYATFPSSESDLHARNSYCRRNLERLTAKLEGCPAYYDEKLAGYWCYVQCMAIGEAAYADGPWISVDGELVHRKNVEEKGIRRAIPCDQSRGIQKSIPFHSKQGLLAQEEFARDWLLRLSVRLQSVKIICGDWSRVCKPSYTTNHGLTGVFLDPPYVTEVEGETAYKMYGNSDPLMDKICQWCLENGSNKQFRIALCGYEGTFPPYLLESGWTEVPWVAGGGRITTGGQSDINRGRERILFSPHCLKPSEQMSLFDDGMAV